MSNREKLEAWLDDPNTLPNTWMQLTFSQIDKLAGTPYDTACKMLPRILAKRMDKSIKEVRSIRMEYRYKRGLAKRRSKHVVMKDPLDKRVSEIRDLVNEPRKHHTLIENNALFLMLCSCMDTIQDTEKALDSFLTQKAGSSDIGMKYLRVYGALQALIVQQDAVENLHESLDIQYPADSSLKKIRRIRIDAAGHPTNIRNKKAFNFIGRSSLSSTYGFQLTTIYPRLSKDEDLEYKHEDINVQDMIATQKSIFVKILDDVIEVLKKEQVEHRKKFIGRKLTSTFQTTTDLFLKIIEAIISIDSPNVLLVDNYVDDILKSVDEFKKGLKDREESDDEISYVYRDIDTHLQRIKIYFNRDVEAHIPPRNARISAEAAQHRVAELEEIAREVDERYGQ